MPVFITRHLTGEFTWMRTILFCAAGTVAVSGLMFVPQSFAQSSAAVRPRFEIISIRQGCPGGEGPNGPPASWMDRPTPGRLSFCAIFVNLIDDAYFHYAGGHVNPSPIRPPHVGDPSWFESDKYMLNAKAEGNASQEIMRGPMLQALLEERLKLRVHWETREVPVYRLTVAKGGPKLQSFKEGSCIPFNFSHIAAHADPNQTCRNGIAKRA